MVGNSATVKPISEKRKKELFKQLVRDAIGVSLTSVSVTY